MGSGLLARLGVVGLIGIGLTRFLEGFLRLDCGGMDEVCENTSWQADGHKIETGIASALLFLVPPLLALAFRRLPEWRDLDTDAPSNASCHVREHPLQRAWQWRGTTRGEHHLVSVAGTHRVAAVADCRRQAGPNASPNGDAEPRHLTASHSEHGAEVSDAPALV